MSAWVPFALDLSGWEAWAIPAAALLCAGLALAAGLTYARRRRAVPPIPDIPGPREDWRGAPRRPTGVPVHISSAASLPEPIAGWVINGSAGGLCLSVEQPVPKGAILSVRPTKAPPGTPPVQVQVQRCKPAARRWALGCRFVQAPPANVLGLFGG
jgi:hypothetical protein